MAERFVIDASVAAKWFLKDSLEDHLELAEEILVDALSGDILLHAPRLMSYEVCRLLWKACLAEGDGGAKRLENERAKNCIKTLFDLPISFAQVTAEEAAESLDLGIQHHKNFYDMTYLRLAGTLSCRVVTADEKLLRSAPLSFPLDRFVRLVDYRQTRSLPDDPASG